MRNSFKFLLGILLISATLNACGGGGGLGGDGGQSAQQVPDPGVVVVQEKSFEQRAQEWAAFVQTRPLEDERLQVFTDLNVGGCCGIASGLSAYLNRLQAEDLTFARIVEQMKVSDTELIHHAQCLTGGDSAVRTCETDRSRSFAELHAAALIENYQILLGQGNTARQRLIETAAILGWTILPATDLPDDVIGQFVEPINGAIRDAAANDASAFGNAPVPQIDASLLQAVSLKLDDGSLNSFFQFSIVTDGSAGSLGLVTAGQNNLINVIRF